MSSRRKACNDCKQQKLRCDLTSAQVLTVSDYCSRCRRLGLACRIDDGFRRTRKRRQPTDLESEIQSLREQLRASQSNTSTSSQHNGTDWPVPAPVGTPGVVFNTLNQTDIGLNFSPVRPDSTPVSIDFPDATTNDADLQCLTTRPEEIDELFNITNPFVAPYQSIAFRLRYIKHNHPYLPLIAEKKSPHEYYERSDLLFWVIMAVAARRHKSQPTLLPRLARNVTDLLWKTLRSMSHSISTIRALCLLCTWPFPTSSSTSDPTFMLVGIMLQMSTQMGLHCAFDAQDFAKVPLKLDTSEYSEWVQTWEACNIVAISVSIGCGLPLFSQVYESPSASQFESSSSESPFYLRLQIERFRLRVSLSLARPMPTGGEGALTRERSMMYHLLNLDLDELEKECSGSCDTEAWYLLAARLHLQAFYLFDHFAMEGYKDRIVGLFSTAYNLVDLGQRLNARLQGFFNHCPFFCYQTYVNAAFVLLKILTNGFFNPIVDAKAGKQLLESSITGLRQMSVANNDLPARLGDIIGFFCALPDPAVVGGVTLIDLQLKQVRNRLRRYQPVPEGHGSTMSLETSGRILVSSKTVLNQTPTLIDAIGGNFTSPSITGAHGLIHSSAEACSRLRSNWGISFAITTYKTRATSISAPSWLAASGPHSMAVGHDGEGDVTAGEMPDGEAPRPSAASPISSGEPVIESGRMKFDEELKAMINDRPIDTRCARRHLSLETSRTFNVDFDFDADPDCVLVERWVPKCEQGLMLKHTNASVRNGSKISWRRRQAGGSSINKPLADSSNPRKLKPEGDIGSLSGNLSNDSEDYHDSAGGHITSNARRLRRRVQGTSLAFHDPPPDTKLGEQQPEGGVSENVSGHLPTNDEEVDEESLLLRREQLRRLQKTQRRALSF
ncbi:uncharacterized protein FOBCDRAFT_250905 [Fusarium oxysporum Fo47]|uniref:uncharacterized protein n=1 Tax=Fusarium oxysporum Fo47 TaxID=660027 RepID=UPI002869E479|nr:uncharacterized protein FOBCDRAFT_250905 [Fusarium oxysporum Fo47]WJG35417.1 hypothetical protein FOBCDRAFT_250905 [Fusarium oxysporum Fo47]